MSDRLKLPDPKIDTEAERVAADPGSVPAKSSPSKNKIGARMHGSLMAISTAPSINHTPIGPCMVPIAYPTVQDLTNSIGTAKTVNFNGCPAYLLDGSTQTSCRGDAAGTGKGVRSGTVSGEVKPTQGSKTVRIEGKRVVRAGDSCTMNGGNNPGVYVTKCSIGAVPPQSRIDGLMNLRGATVGSLENAAPTDAHNLFDLPKLTPSQQLSRLMQKDILDGTAFKHIHQQAEKTSWGPKLIAIDEEGNQTRQNRTRNNLTIALLGVFGGFGAAARLNGLSEERVAAANEIGAAGMGVIWSLSSLPSNSGIRPAARTSLRDIGKSSAVSLAKVPASVSNDGVKITSGTSKDAFHATSTSKLAASVLKGIDKEYLNARSRFGKAFHVAEEPETAIAEMLHHGIDPTTGIRFKMNASAMKVLDLTDSKIAESYGYKGGPITDKTRAIGEAALKNGYNVIRYRSERNPTGINNAVISDFNEILKPQIVTPIKK